MLLLISTSKAVGAEAKNRQLHPSLLLAGGHLVPDSWGTCPLHLVFPASQEAAHSGSAPCVLVWFPLRVVWLSPCGFMRWRCCPHRLWTVFTAVHLKQELWGVDSVQSSFLLHCGAFIACEDRRMPITPLCFCLISKIYLYRLWIWK